MRSCTCPNCNANLTIQNDDRDFVFCEFCGTKIMLDDYRETHRFVDEAEVKKAETDRLIRIKQLELREKEQSRNAHLSDTLFKVWLGATVLLVLITLFMMISGSSRSFIILIYIDIIVIAGGAHLIFKVLPGKAVEQELLRSGDGIRLPTLTDTLDKTNYEALKHSLEIAGFRDIQCINLHDLRLGLLKKKGSIEEVIINGSDQYVEHKVIPANSTIVIKYHGM